MGINLTTMAEGFRRALTTSSTATSFASKIPTVTEPTGEGVIDLSGGGLFIPNAAFLVPFGAGADNGVFAMRLIGWRKLGGSNPNTAIWIPVVLTELTCTMSTMVGVGSTLLASTDRICDTIVLVTGNDDVSIDIVSPTGDVAAHAVADIKGCQKIEFDFDLGSGSPTSANCLVALL